MPDQPCRWSCSGTAGQLLVLRDMVFVGARRFRELLAESPKGISSNVLADRLGTLVEHGMLTRSSDPGHKQKVIYNLPSRRSNWSRS